MPTFQRISTLLFALFVLIGTSLYMNVFDIWHQKSTPPRTDKQKASKLNHSMKHLAIIMDGNRRWAEKQGLEPWFGHKQGTDAVKKTVEFCVEQKIPYLSLYTFSLENFKRSPQELDYLFETIEAGITDEEFNKLTENGVRVKFIGDRSQFPARLVKTVQNIETKTDSNTNLTLNLLFCYGGQQELAEAMRTMGHEIAQGRLNPTQITPELIQQHLWTSNSPNPDLIIRTGGKQRLSNFLPWQSAYSELLFLEKYWPAITKQDLYNAVQEFTLIQRNFGV